MDDATRLHDAITAARDGHWARLEELVFLSAGTRALSDEMINSVPSPRKYGIVHQIAYHGSKAAFETLTARGVVFDLSVLTQDGKTAQEIAQDQGMHDFAAMLAAVPALGPPGAHEQAFLPTQAAPTGATYFHIEPSNNQRVPFSEADNAVIFAAQSAGAASVPVSPVTLGNGAVLHFEVRFGPNAKSLKMPRVSPTGICQVNLANENTRLVERGSPTYTPPPPTPAPALPDGYYPPSPNNHGEPEPEPDHAAVPSALGPNPQLVALGYHWDADVGEYVEPRRAHGAKGVLLTLFDLIGAPPAGKTVHSELTAGAYPGSDRDFAELQARLGPNFVEEEVQATFAYEHCDVVRRDMHQLLRGDPQRQLHRTVYAHYEFLIRCANHQLRAAVPRPILNLWRPMKSWADDDQLDDQPLKHKDSGDTVTVKVISSCYPRRVTAELVIRQMGHGAECPLVHVLARPADASGFHAGIEVPREVTTFQAEGEEFLPPLTAMLILHATPDVVTVDVTYVPQLFADSLKAQEAVWEEIKAGGSSALVQWLSETPVVNLETPHSVYGCTLLYSAAYFGNLAAVKAMVQRCAHIDSQLSKAKSTALHAASWNGHPEVVRFLLDNRANYELTNVHNYTPLEEATPDCTEVFRTHEWCADTAAAPSMESKFATETLHFGSRSDFLDDITQYLGPRPPDLAAAVEREFQRDIKWTDAFANNAPDAYSAIEEWRSANTQLSELRAKPQAREAGLLDVELLALRLYTAPAYIPVNKFLREICCASPVEAAELRGPDRTWAAFAWAILDAFDKLSPPVPTVVTLPTVDASGQHGVERSDVATVRQTRAAAATLRGELNGATLPELIVRAQALVPEKVSDDELLAAQQEDEPKAAIIDVIVDAMHPDPLPVLYRGVGRPLKPEFFIPDERGMVSAMEFAFASTSKKSSVADEFIQNTISAGGAAVRFEIISCVRDAAGNHSGVDIEWLSASKREKEVLFPPFTLFRVIEMARDGNLTTLRVCPTWTSWQKTPSGV